MTALRWIVLGVLGLLSPTIGEIHEGEIKVENILMPPGGMVLVEYDNLARAGEVIFIEIDNGVVPGTSYDFVFVQLDHNGQGASAWNVPDNWPLANFNELEAATVTRVIGGPQ